MLKLVARGLSNAEIAKELFVSETAVKTHVAHVLAYECGLAGVLREDDAEIHLVDDSSLHALDDADESAVFRS